MPVKMLDFKLLWKFVVFYDIVCVCVCECECVFIFTSFYREVIGYAGKHY